MRIKHLFKKKFLNPKNLRGGNINHRNSKALRILKSFKQNRNGKKK